MAGMDPGLHGAVTLGDHQTMEKLITGGASINSVLGMRGTPLCAAISNNQLSMASRLLHAGCDVNGKDCDGELPLSLAIRKCHVDMIQLLISHGCLVDRKDPVTDLPPLCAAAELGLLEVVRWLLEAGCNVNIQDASGNTALHIATQKGYMEIVREILCCLTCSPNIHNIAGNTPLHIATLQGDLLAVGLLVGHDRVEGQAIEEISNTSVAQCSYPDSEIQGLFHNQCFVDIERSRAIVESTAISVIQRRPADAVCEINKGTRYSEETALHLAVLQAQPQVLDLLISSGADLNTQNNEGQTPLFVACNKGNMDMAKSLLKAGANPHIVGTMKKFMHNYVLCNKKIAPLSLSASQNNVELTSLLLECGQSFPASESVVESLFLALSRGAGKAALCLLSNLHRLDYTFDINARYHHGNTLLGVVANCVNQQTALAEKLIEFGCDLNAVNPNGDTPLHNAVFLECHELIEVLLSHGADWTIRNNDGLNPLHCCSLYDQQETAETLLSNGVDIDSLTSSNAFDDSLNERSALSVAVQVELPDLTRYLVERGANLNQETYLFTDSTHQTPGQDIIDPDMIDLFAEEPELFDWLKELSHNPVSLSCSCIRGIRRHFRGNGLSFNHINQLPIPKIMVNKLLCKETCL